MSRHDRRPAIVMHLRSRELVKLFRRRLGEGPNKPQLDAAIMAACGCDPMDLSASELGDRVGLTLQERYELTIRTIAASDKTPQEVNMFYREKRRERDRAAARRRRQKLSKPVASKAGRQLDKVRAVLRQRSEDDPAHWSTVDEIAAAVGKSRAFAGLKPGSLRAAIRDALDALAAEIEQDTAIGKRLPVRLARMKTRLSCAPTEKSCVRMTPLT
jgi:hypothetical protein